MERATRVRALVARASAMIEQGGDREDALRMLPEAIELLRKIEADAARFRDLIGEQHGQAK